VNPSGGKTHTCRQFSGWGDDRGLAMTESGCFFLKNTMWFVSDALVAFSGAMDTWRCSRESVRDGCDLLLADVG